MQDGLGTHLCRMAWVPSYAGWPGYPAMQDGLCTQLCRMAWVPSCVGCPGYSMAWVPSCVGWPGYPAVVYMYACCMPPVVVVGSFNVFVVCAGSLGVVTLTGTLLGLPPGR